MSDIPKTLAPAPESKPAAPPAPPAAAPSAPPPDTGLGSGPDPFAEVDAPFLAALEKVEGKPATKPDAAPDPAKPAAKPEAAKPAAAAPAAKAVDRTPAALRAEHERLKTEHEAVKLRIPELEKKISEAEAKGKDTETMRERLAAMEKEKTSLLADLRMYKREKSPEFLEKYQKPFDESANIAQSEIEQLEMTEDGENYRPAKWDDFIAIWNMPMSKAISAAKIQFGDASQIVVNHLTELRRLDRQKNIALEDERQHAAERMKAEETRVATMNEQERILSDRVFRELADKVEDYRDLADDAESAEIRKKAYSVFDAEPKTARERIIVQAHIRHRVAAFGPMKLKILRLEKELSELKGKSGETQDPRTVHHPGGDSQTGASTKTWEEEAREMTSQV
jgi:hypothetical protein